MSDDPTAKLWAQAVEEHIAGMPEADFSALVERTRPKPIDQMSYREVRESIARKSNASRELTHRRANGGGPPAN